MTLQLLHSEFPYIWGKFYFLFYQCVKNPSSIATCIISPQYRRQARQVLQLPTGPAGDHQNRCPPTLTLRWERGSWRRTSLPTSGGWSCSSKHPPLSGEQVRTTTIGFTTSVFGRHRRCYAGLPDYPSVWYANLMPRNIARRPIEIVPRLCLCTFGFYVVINTQSNRFFTLSKIDVT